MQNPVKLLVCIRLFACNPAQFLVQLFELLQNTLRRVVAICTHGIQRCSVLGNQFLELCSVRSKLCQQSI